jgi:hypothetical protein
MDSVLSVVILLTCAACLHLATGPVYAASPPVRVVKVVALALSVGIIVLVYRFLLFLIILYGTQSAAVDGTALPPQSAQLREESIERPK